jgi:hypothetical protein
MVFFMRTILVQFEKEYFAPAMSASANHGMQGCSRWCIGKTGGVFRAPPPSTRLNGVTIKFWETSVGNESMTEGEKDAARAVAAAGAGAGVGGAGGATAGVLELAAQGVLSGLSAGVVIGAGAAVGGLIGYGLYRFLKKPKR